MASSIPAVAQRAAPLAAAAAASSSVTRTALDNTPYWQRVDNAIGTLRRPIQRYRSADTDQDELFEQSDWLDAVTEEILENIFFSS